MYILCGIAVVGAALAGAVYGVNRTIDYIFGGDMVKDLTIPKTK